MSQPVGHQLKWGLQIGTGVGFLMVGIGACVVPLVQFSAQHLKLDEEGVRVTATVTQKDMTHGHQSLPPMGGMAGVASTVSAAYRLGRVVESQRNGELPAGQYDSFAIQYSFTPSNGEPLFAVQSVSRETYNDLRVGSKIQVVYHPANPQIQRLPAYTIPFEDSSLLKRILIALFCFPLGIYTLYLGISNAKAK